jgi:threonine synthase
MNGVVRHVDDDTMLDNKALVGRFGYSCEPASAASVAGVSRLRAEGVIGPADRVVCVLTGHGLKDPDAVVKYHAGLDAKAATWPEPVPPTGRIANPPMPVRDDLNEIIRRIERADGRDEDTPRLS